MHDLFKYGRKASEHGYEPHVIVGSAWLAATLLAPAATVAADMGITAAGAITEGASGVLTIAGTQLAAGAATIGLFPNAQINFPKPSDRLRARRMKTLNDLFSAIHDNVAHWETNDPNDPRFVLYNYYKYLQDNPTHDRHGLMPKVPDAPKGTKNQPHGGIFTPKNPPPVGPFIPPTPKKAVPVEPFKPVIIDNQDRDAGYKQAVKKGLHSVVGVKRKEPRIGSADITQRIEYPNNGNNYPRHFLERSIKSDVYGGSIARTAWTQSPTPTHKGYTVTTSTSVNDSDSWNMIKDAAAAMYNTGRMRDKLGKDMYDWNVNTSHGYVDYPDSFTADDFDELHDWQTKLTSKNIGALPLDTVYSKLISQAMSRHGVVLDVADLTNQVQLCKEYIAHDPNLIGSRFENARVAVSNMLAGAIDYAYNTKISNNPINKGVGGYAGTIITKLGKGFVLKQAQVRDKDGVDKTPFSFKKGPSGFAYDLNANYTSESIQQLIKDRIPIYTGMNAITKRVNATMNSVYANSNTVTQFAANNVTKNALLDASAGLNGPHTSVPVSVAPQIILPMGGVHK